MKAVKCKRENSTLDDSTDLKKDSQIVSHFVRPDADELLFSKNVFSILTDKHNLSAPASCNKLSLKIAL